MKLLSMFFFTSVDLFGVARSAITKIKSMNTNNKLIILKKTMTPMFNQTKKLIVVYLDVFCSWFACFPHGTWTRIGRNLHENLITYWSKIGYLSLGASKILTLYGKTLVKREWELAVLAILRNCYGEIFKLYCRLTNGYRHYYTKLISVPTTSLSFNFK